MNEREILAMKKRLEVEYRKEVEALDTVLNLIRRKNADNGASSSLGGSGSNGDSQRVRGVLAAVRGLLGSLDGTFDRTTVMERLRALDPELAEKVTLGNIRGTLRFMQQKGDIEIVAPASGKQPVVYRKVG